MKAFPLILCLLLLLPTISAYHMRLIAVTEVDGKLVGSPADITLDILPGNGRVYIDTYPLSKLDTQISTRLAKDVACTYIEEDCSHKDFIYTLRSGSTLIGGPSAGAAITLLTIASLKGWNVPEDIVLTGTINSGGIIGPVGGVVEKIQASQDINLSTIYIPFGDYSRSIDQTDYQNIFPVDSGNKTFHISIKEVSTLGDVMEDLFDYKLKTSNVTIDREYSDKMKLIAERLCKRAQDMSTLINISSDATDYINRSERALAKGRFYSQASYCFTANLDIRRQLLANASDNYVIQLTGWLHEKINEYENLLEDYQTITMTDFQARIIVKKRLQEALSHLDNIYQDIKDNPPTARKSLADGIERYYSAIFWGMFFESEGAAKHPDISNQETSCIRKINEAEERRQYLSLFIKLKDDKHANSALRYYEQGEFDLCILEASKTKAESDIMLSLLQRNDFDTLVESKLKIVGANIEYQTSRGEFPILGYSYYEYAQSLKEDQPYLALLFLEYSLEMSNLEEYFPKSSSSFALPPEMRIWLVFLLGLILGLLISLYYQRRSI